ncbi:MAG TPA: pitrilysin family protein [Burkholderiaceae bacterium]|nr:pitrilysin family protein [Burkholderiaceae bacterium]
MAQQAFAALPIQHWKLSNGAEVSLVESPAIPMLDVTIDVDAGSRRDPAAQAGLASAMAGMMTRGLRASDAGPPLDENALGEAWADTGASFGPAVSADRMSFSLRTLTTADLLERTVQLAARELAEPAFPEAVWQRERERGIAAIKEAETRPATHAGRAFGKAVYGEHPYGYETTAQTLSNISVADMRQLHGRALLPCRMKISLVGAITRAQADDLARKLLARLPSGESCPAQADVPEVQPLAAPSETHIPFDAAQAHVMIGQPGYKRDDPDFFPLLVGNYILGGGGFVSRLMTEVREKRGLTYGVGSGFSPGLHAGAFSIGLQTRPDQADEALRVSRDVLARFVAEGPTKAELQAAKDNLIGGFALRIDSNRKLLDNVANIAWNRLPLDYLDTWTQRVAAVTADEVRAAFQRKLQPDRMATVVVGARPSK